MYIYVLSIVCVSISISVVLAVYFFLWRSQKLVKLERLVIKYAQNKETFENSTNSTLNTKTPIQYRPYNLDENLKQVYNDFKSLLPQKYLEKIKCDKVTPYMIDCVMHQVARDNTTPGSSLLDTLSALTLLKGWITSGMDVYTYNRKTQILTNSSGWKEFDNKTAISLEQLYSILIKRLTQEKSTYFNYPNIDCLCQPSI